MVLIIVSIMLSCYSLLSEKNNRLTDSFKNIKRSAGGAYKSIRKMEFFKSL
jgi:hypothetical protein